MDTNNIGKVVSLIRKDAAKNIYLINVLAPDLQVALQQVQGVTIGVELDIDEVVNLNLVGSVWYVSVSGKSGSIVAVLQGKHTGGRDENNEPEFDSDPDTAPDTLVYVGAVIEPSDLYAAIEAGEEDLSTLPSSTLVLCRQLEGDPTAMLEEFLVVKCDLIQDDLYSMQVVTESKTVPCRIVSRILDFKYAVVLYHDGMLGDQTNATAEQLDIDASEIIPAGTWAMATQASDGVWYMQVPVWL